VNLKDLKLLNWKMVRPKQNDLKLELHVLKAMKYHHLQNLILRVELAHDESSMDKTPVLEINDILHFFHKAMKIKTRRSGASLTSNMLFEYFMMLIC